MAEARLPGLRLWAGRAGYLALMTAIAVLAMLPGEAVPRRWPLPDVALMITFAWIVRRPAEVPTLSIAAVFLAADFLTGHAPGLRAALVLIAAEHLRAHARRPEGLGAEWARAGAAILTVAVLERVALGLTLAPAPPLGPVVLRALGGAAGYPLAVAFVVLVLGVRRPAPPGSRRPEGGTT